MYLFVVVAGCQKTLWLIFVRSDIYFTLSFLIGKPNRRFVCQMRVQREFVSAYSNISSAESHALISEFKGILEYFFRRIFISFLELIFRTLFPGSIGMEFEIVFQPASNVSNTSIVEALEKGNRTGELASLNITGRITVTEQLPGTENTTLSPSSSAAPTGILLPSLMLV